MAEIEFDTSQLTFPKFLIPQQTDFLDGSAVPRPRVALPPGTYRYQLASGLLADFTFTVGDDGKLAYDRSFDDFLEGRGTTRLTVRGFPMQLDFTALDHDLLPLIAGAGFLSHARTHDLRLVPASGYRFQPGSGILATFDFRVDTDGRLQVPTAFASFATVTGNRLTITGHTVRIDARGLDHDLLPISLAGYTGGFLSHSSVHELRIIPGAGYGFQPGSGIVAELRYTLDADGALHIDPKHQGYAATTGNLLRITGRRIFIDGRGLSHDLLPIALAGREGGFLSRTRVNQLTLIPAKGYNFQPGSGIVADMRYDVGVDGHVSFPLDCKPFLSGEGSDTLVVDGYPILVDARRADSDLRALANLGVMAEARRYVFAVLVPADGYLPQTANGVFGTGFGVERDGTISFDADAAGRYVVTPIPRLEIRGSTPF